METEPLNTRVRLAEVVASLSLGTDLAVGLPMEHGLRRTLIASWLAEEAGLTAGDRRAAYYVALLGSVGCVLNGAAFADCLTDEIEFRGSMFTVDMSRTLPAMSYTIRNGAPGETPLTRARMFLSLIQRGEQISRDIATQCGDLMDLGPDVRQALGQCDEHWNGKHAVLGLKGEEISIAARLFLLAQDIDVYHRAHGPEDAAALVRERSGTFYDPNLATTFLRSATPLLKRVDAAPAWDTVLTLEPEPARTLSTTELREVLQRMANFVDIRSTYTAGHSTSVAALAAGAGAELGLSPMEVSDLHHAGLLHDLGRFGVPVSSWDKRKPLSSREWDRMRQHAALTEVILARSTALGPLGTVAALHHERLDGSGYRGVSAASMPLTARVLAAADTYQSKIERRPHRPALDPGTAAEHLHAEVRQRRLDGDAVAALLRGAGHVHPQRTPAPRLELTDRELEVLGLLVRGLTNREMSEVLVVSPKTVGHHVESIYRKLGVSTRAGATIFAVSRGLVGLGQQ